MKDEVQEWRLHLRSKIAKQAAGCEAWIDDESQHPAVWLAERTSKSEDKEDFLVRIAHAPFLRHRFFNGISLWDITMETFESFAAHGDIEVWEDVDPYPDADRIREWVWEL